MKNIIIYTDGACRGNPGPGGWGALLMYGDQEKTLFGAEMDTTNNRMELMAAIQALMTVREPCQIALYTDSQYVRKGISEWLLVWKKNQWKKADKTPVKNIDLWQALDQQAARHHISWHWVRGHSNHPLNDRVDAIANHAIDNLLKK